jgi:ABC-type nitrate/sulfonate/bicarbonate transport system substrate-binding protein
VKIKFAGFAIWFLMVTLVINSRAPAAVPTDPQLKKITVAYTSFAPAQMWLWLEKDLGYFREEGLRPELIMVRNGGIAVKGLMAGNFDYMASGGPVIDAIVRTRQPLKLVLTSEQAHFWLMAQSPIRSIADLKGKTVAVNAVGSPTDFTMQEILKRHGLTAYKDVTFVAIGNSSQRFAALVSGAVNSALVSPPFNLKAQELGYRKLADAADYVKWPQTGLATRDDKISQDREEVLKMIRAAVKGLKFMLAQREYVQSRMMHIFHLSQEEAAKTYEIVHNEGVFIGPLGDQAEREVISIAKRAANVIEEIPPDRVFDNSFVKQAEQELKGWRPQTPK